MAHDSGLTLCHPCDRCIGVYCFKDLTTGTKMASLWWGGGMGGGDLRYEAAEAQLQR